MAPTNALKWSVLHPQRSVYDFCEADLLVAFAKEHNMSVHGHTLAWFLQNPNWLESGGFSRDELISILRDHIYSVIGHFNSKFPGVIGAWDVVNEAVDNCDGPDPCPLRHNVWLDGIGPEYIDMAFQFAREVAQPGVKLFYNDYGAEGIDGPKSDAVYSLVTHLKSLGLIDAVGFQMHVAFDAFPSVASVEQNMSRLASAGLEVFISEMDVKARSNYLVEQAEVYYWMLQACLGNPNCTSFTTWGITDRYVLPDVPFFEHNPGYAPADVPFIFDATYNPKTAYYWLRDCLTLC
jgi:endo-1,4-beta-xylanase